MVLSFLCCKGLRALRIAPGSAQCLEALIGGGWTKNFFSTPLSILEKGVMMIFDSRSRTLKIKYIKDFKTRPLQLP